MATRMALMVWLWPPATVASAALAAEERPEKATAANANVQPGLVRWHKDFPDACAAAKKSARPVLLFHLMGKLDQQFC
jgi:hypothetical protein